MLIFIMLIRLISFFSNAVLIIGGSEYNDDPGGNSEDPGELNGVV